MQMLLLVVQFFEKKFLSVKICISNILLFDSALLFPCKDSVFSTAFCFEISTFVANKMVYLFFEFYFMPTLSIVLDFCNILTGFQVTVQSYIQLVGTKGQKCL
jgi:hypothetical protein